ncbi:hypothetical protein D3C81_1748800 [compost metagenome]
MHVQAWRHQTGNTLVVQAQGARDNIVLGFFKQAGIGAFAEQTGDFLFGHRIIFFVMHAEYAQDEFGGTGQYFNKRSHQARQPQHRRGDY